MIWRGEGTFGAARVACRIGSGVQGERWDRAGEDFIRAVEGAVHLPGPSRSIVRSDLNLAPRRIHPRRLDSSFSLRAALSTKHIVPRRDRQLATPVARTIIRWLGRSRRRVVPQIPSSWVGTVHHVARANHKERLFPRRPCGVLKNTECSRRSDSTSPWSHHPPRPPRDGG